MGKLCGPGDGVRRPVEQHVVLLAPLQEIKVLDRPPLLPEELGKAERLVRLAREDDDSSARARLLLGWGWRARRRWRSEAWALEGEERMEGRGRAGRASQALSPALIENLQGAALDVFLGPAGGVDGHHSPAVGVRQPFRAADAAVVA